MSRTELAICEIFNPVIHGSNSNNSYGIDGHFLVHNTISLDDWYNHSFQDIITLLRDAYRPLYQRMGKSITTASYCLEL